MTSSLKLHVVRRRPANNGLQPTIGALPVSVVIVGSGCAPLAAEAQSRSADGIVSDLNL
jgi:hypothetical protein